MPETQRDQLYATIYEVVNDIPAGKVATYGQIAQLIGLPRHARHVGFALANLAPDSSIPWHRVVNAQGKTHPKHGRSVSFQKDRLSEEGITFNSSQRIDLKKFQWQPDE